MFQRTARIKLVYHQKSKMLASRAECKQRGDIWWWNTLKVTWDDDKLLQDLPAVYILVRSTKKVNGPWN
jgi:hypothetical protein